MLNKKIVTIILVVFMFVLGYLNYCKYPTVKEYDEFTKTDFIYYDSTLIRTNIARQIMKKAEIYERVLSTNRIRKDDAETLRFFSNNNADFVPRYQRYGIVLKRLKPIDGEIVTEPNMIMIHDFFLSLLDSRWAIPEEEKEDILIELDDELRIKIEYLNELNNLWVNSLERNLEWVEEGEIDYEKHKEYFQNNIKPLALHKYWSNLVIDIEKDTREFLSKHQVDNIKKLLQ